MPYASDSTMSPLSYAGAGAAAGAGGVLAVQAVKSAKSRANWALGIGIGVLGLMLANSGNLQTATTTAQNIAVSNNALTLSVADFAAIGVSLSNLRAQITALANNQGQGFYYANPIGNLFQTQPTAQPTTVQLAAVTSGTVIQSSNSNSNLAVLLLVGIGVAAVVLS